jgi:hypothetical protein
MGYGYSVWYVPTNYKTIQSRYGMAHIPHITVATNFPNANSAFVRYNKLPKTTRAFIKRECVEFPSMYADNPLKAIGWYGEMPDVPTAHPPHMTLRYFDPTQAIPTKTEYCNAAPSNRALVCFKTVADTTSSNPADWKFIPYSR